jgi:hypothetical protein
MRASSKRIVSLVTLIVFMMSVVAYHFNSARFAHELDHDIHSFEITDNHVHTSLFDHDAPASKPLSDTDHQLLHSVGHFQPFLTSSIFTGYGDLSIQIAPIFLHFFLLPLAEIEPLFRPPRTSNPL